MAFRKRDAYTVDAKSPSGLMNPGPERRIGLEVYDENCEDLFEDIAPFVEA